MIDLTPLDVRNKRGDFKKALRGYESQEVDVFLELVAERLEALVRENLQLRERSQTLAQQVDSQSGRERAVQEALVTAQELRADIRAQAQREAELILEEARSEARRTTSEAEGDARARLRQVEARLEQTRSAVEEIERRRARFLKTYRQLLERELDVVEVEQGRAPYEERAIELDLAQSREDAEVEPEVEPSPEAEHVSEKAAPAEEPPFDAASAEAALDRVFRMADPSFGGPPATEGDRAEEGDGSEGDAGESTATDKPAERPDGGLFTLPDFPPVPEDGGEDPRWG